MVIPPYLRQCVASVTEWWRNNLKASSIWRLTSLYTALLLCVVSLLLIILYQLSVGQIKRNQIVQMENLVEQQKLLAKQLELNDFIQQFEMHAANSRQYILTFRHKGNTYGQLSSIPTYINSCPTLSRFPIWLEKYDELRLISGCILHISTGTLFIANDDESLYNLQTQFLNASLVALLSALILGIFTGFIFSRRVLKRIRTFNNIAQRVEAGEMTARVPISSNADEYDDMARHINTMLSRLEDSFNAISTVTDAIAHDLRTPLSHLKQQIEENINDAHKAGLNSDHLQKMITKLDAILFTFTAMLEITRLEHSQQKEHFTLVCLDDVINDAIDLIHPLIEEKQQNLHITGANCLLQGDATLLFRVVYNLLENACKYAGEFAQISIDISNKGFTLSDNGQGIADSEKEKVFQRLYRIEKSRNIAGFGIGLSLVKAIVRLHDGKIKLLDNNPGLKVVIEFTDTH